MPWRQRILLIVLLLLVALALLWAFLPRAVPVETAKVSRGPLRVTVEEEGKTRLRDRFVISAPVAGYARRGAPEGGDPVERGEGLRRDRADAGGGARPADPGRRGGAGPGGRGGVAGGGGTGPGGGGCGRVCGGAPPSDPPPH